MAKPCTPHLHCAARAALRATDCQCKSLSFGRAPPVFFPRKENGGCIMRHQCRKSASHLCEKSCPPRCGAKSSARASRGESSSIRLTKNPRHGMLCPAKGSEKEAFSFHPLKRGDGRCKSLRNGKGGAFEPCGGNAAPVPPLQGNEVPRIQRGIQVEPRTMIGSP